MVLRGPFDAQHDLRPAGASRQHAAPEAQAHGVWWPVQQVQVSLGHEALDEVAAGIKDVHKAVAGSRNVVMLGRVLQGKSHEETAADVADAERSESGREIRVGKGASQGRLGKVLVEDVDGSGAEV